MKPINKVYYMRTDKQGSIYRYPGGSIVVYASSTYAAAHLEMSRINEIDSSCYDWIVPYNNSKDLLTREINRFADRRFMLPEPDYICLPKDTKRMKEYLESYGLPNTPEGAKLLRERLYKGKLDQ